MSPLQIAAAMLAACALLWSLIALARYRRRNILRERALRGQSGEELAWVELRRRFARVERHPRRTARLWIDGSEQRYEVCPDFAVGSARRPIPIEVKSGQDRDPRDPTTRRQLLEYALAFGAPKIGLYDARTRSLQWIELECLPRPQRWRWLLFLLTGLLLGFAADLLH